MEQTQLPKNVRSALVRTGIRLQALSTVSRRSAVIWYRRIAHAFPDIVTGMITYDRYGMIANEFAVKCAVRVQNETIESASDEKAGGGLGERGITY